MIADGLGSTDQGISTLLLIGAFATGWVALSRLRGQGYARLPRAGATALAVVSATLVVLAGVIPPILRPSPTAARPASTATIRILSPSSGEVFRGNPATIPIRLDLAGGRVVSFTSTRLVPDEGHIHLFLDGTLLSMSFSLRATTHALPGRHVLRAEFVALDHGPFRPPVAASVQFRVIA